MFEEESLGKKLSNRKHQPFEVTFFFSDSLHVHVF